MLSIAAGREKRAFLFSKLDSEMKSSNILQESQIGHCPGQEGQWASQIRIISPFSMETLSIFELLPNEQAVSICLCNFADSSETFLCVGAVKDMILNPER